MTAVLLSFLLLAPMLAMAAPFAGVVMDARSGKVLWEHNADTRLHPASLTKMLTLYIAFDAIKRGEISQDDMVRISAHAAKQPPSRLGLRAGQQISLRHLIRAAAIKSANDAASAIGDHISGSEAAFAKRMNRTAKALGMSRSTFRNAHGLTADGHLSTARDMNLLGRRLFYDFPEFYGIFSRLTEDAGIAKVSNTNRRFLEGYRGADGIKTGYTGAAGFNLTASAERDGKRLVATVFGGTSTAQRNQKMAEIMNAGFSNAPIRVPNNPPPKVALAEVAIDQVVREAAATAGGAGKTIRLQTARATSPRPMPRPELAPPPEQLAQLTSGVAEMLAELTPEPVQTAAAPARPEARPEVQETAAVALPQETVAVSAPADQDIPFELTAEPAVLTAEADLPEDLPAPMADDGEALPDQIRTAAALVVPELSGFEPNRRPRARPGEIVMTMTAAATPADRTATRTAAIEPAAQAQVVTRVSASGGRHWAITLGKFPNRGTAERALIQTALSETRTLDGALRKVVQRGGSWEATFAGLTQDQADLACRRLQARAVGCFTLGP